MVRGKYGNAKYRQIAGEIETLLRTGNIQLTGNFFTREELARRYGVSPLTAYHALKHLESEGILTCGRGRRAKLALDGLEQSVAPEKKCRILIGCLDDANGTPSLSCAWIVNYLRNRFRNDGHMVDVLALSTPDLFDRLAESDAMVLLSDPTSDEPLHIHLKQWGKPYVMFSFLHPAENTVYLLPQLFLSQILLSMMRHSVRRLVFVHGGESPLERLFQKKGILATLEDQLKKYSSSCELLHTEVLRAGDSASMAELDRLIGEAKDCKTGFICCNVILCDYLFELLSRERLKIPSECVLAGVCRVGMEPMDFPAIDIKLPELANSMIAMLYRELKSGKSSDPGSLHIPVFEEKIRL